MNKFLNNFKSGLTIGLGFLVMVIIGGIVYASLSQVEPGDTLSASKWNEIVNTMNGLQQATPSGAVIAFNLKTCPSGWLPANGSGNIAGENIPDLRGKFIRGLNSFENGSNKLTGDSSDEDGVNRILGSYQCDTMRPITGEIAGAGAIGSSSYGILTNTATGIGAFRQGTATPHRNGIQANVTGYALALNSALLGNNFKGSDTHPKNIALIYCIKE